MVFVPRWSSSAFASMDASALAAALAAWAEEAHDDPMATVVVMPQVAPASPSWGPNVSKCTRDLRQAPGTAGANGPGPGLTKPIESTW